MSTRCFKALFSIRSMDRDLHTREAQFTAMDVGGVRGVGIRTTDPFDNSQITGNSEITRRPLHDSQRPARCCPYSAVRALPRYWDYLYHAKSHGRGRSSASRVQRWLGLRGAMYQLAPKWYREQLSIRDESGPRTTEIVVYRDT